MRYLWVCHPVRPLQRDAPEWDDEVTWLLWPEGVLVEWPVDRVYPFLAPADPRSTDHEIGGCWDYVTRALIYES